ncbi:vitamin K epoxide reductase family-domain-containing protein, partial [Dunaliella salina]
VKLTGSSISCPVSGCESVLSSSYSELYGVPLSLLGMLTYGAVAAVALAAASQPSSSDKRTLDTCLATGTSLLGGVSGFLIYLLQTEFNGQPCAWCYLSATLSLSLLAIVISGLPARRLQQVAAPSLSALATTVAVLYFNTASVGSSTAAIYELPYS